MQLRILHQDENWLAVDKPAGIHVHPPVDSPHRIRHEENAMALVREQLGQMVFPVHRLDRPTSGVLVFALNSEAAGSLAGQFQNRTARKTYYTVVRGWIEEATLLDRELDEGKASETLVTPLSHVELPFASRPDFATSRFTLARCEPKTGRYHQIRRHLTGISHPLIGDAIHGDSKQNRAFAKATGIPGLLLKAYQLELLNPTTGNPIVLTSRWTSPWHQVFDLFGVCPLHPGTSFKRKRRNPEAPR